MLGSDGIIYFLIHNSFSSNNELNSRRVLPHLQKKNLERNSLSQEFLWKDIPLHCHFQALNFKIKLSFFEHFISPLACVRSSIIMAKFLSIIALTTKASYLHFLQDHPSIFLANNGIHCEVIL